MFVYYNYIEDLPEYVEELKNGTRSYSGKPTALNKLKKFLESWDGNPVKPTELQEQLDISKSAWKEIRKKAGFRLLLDKNNVIETGRGVNARFERNPLNDAAK